MEKFSIIALVLTLVATAGVVGYRYYLQSTLTSIQAQIADAEDAYTTESYDSIRSFDHKVRAARFMLGNRMDHTRIFTALENSVSKSVFYQSFESVIDESGNVALTLGGISPEFAQIVLQTGALAKADLLTNVKMSRIEIKKTDTVDEATFGATANIPRDGLLRNAPAVRTSAAPAASAAANTSASVDASGSPAQ